MFTRDEVLSRLREEIASGRPQMGAGAGTGLSAKCEEAGGADLIIVYNSGRFRMAGRASSAGTMPFGDANGIVVEMAAEVLPVVKHTPVVAGVCASDPFRIMKVFLRELHEIGFSGVQNFPTVGVFKGDYRDHLEWTGMGFDREVEMIALAREMELLTTPYAWEPEQAEAMARAGADVIVAHVGRTTSGMIGARHAMPLDEAVEQVQAMHDAAKVVNSEVIVICHGGPLAYPADVRYVLERTRGVAGFYGASSMERIPAEVAITENMREFKAIGAEEIATGAGGAEA
jgi:predicted TIM-barrel enzyme